MVRKPAPAASPDEGIQSPANGLSVGRHDLEVVERRAEDRVGVRRQAVGTRRGHEGRAPRQRGIEDAVTVSSYVVALTNTPATGRRVGSRAGRRTSTVIVWPPRSKRASPGDHHSDGARQDPQVELQ